MHGRLKVRSSAEQEERKRVEREKKLFMYKSAMAECIKIKEAKKYKDDESVAQIGLKISADVLANQPDIQTLWNMRKEIILSLIEKSDEKREEADRKWFDIEMNLTEVCLRKNPKS